MTRTGAERVTLAGLTRDISSSGVLFTSTREPDLGGPIEYVITLNHNGGQTVQLRCIGKVLRAERVDGSGLETPSFKIAATLERYEFVRE